MELRPPAHGAIYVTMKPCKSMRFSTTYANTTLRSCDRDMNEFKLNKKKATVTVKRTEGGEATAASWRWNKLMDEALKSKRHINPPSPSDSAKDTACYLYIFMSLSTPVKRFPCLIYSCVERAVTPEDDSKDNVSLNSHMKCQEEQRQLLKDTRSFRHLSICVCDLILNR
ncbi:hypothetical protein ABVT39_023789 [Epinephelus coioides]